MTETFGEPDVGFMRRALDLAARGWGRVAPDPMVGAVLVRDAEIVGEGWHRDFGSAHAEVEAISAAGERARGATLYVNLEPCSHQGRTGPCTEAILAAGVAKVVFASADPNPLASGGGESLARAGVQILAGVEERAARSLNASFLRSHQPTAPPRPWTELKLALSLDSRIADSSGRSAWITGEEARAEVHRIRAGYDAVAVGIGTVLADDPLLTVRGRLVPRQQPARVIFDRRLRLPPTSRLAASADESRVIAVCGQDAPTAARDALVQRGIEVIEAVDLVSALAQLRAGGVLSLLCEGGAGLASAMLNDDVVDRLTLFYAPLLLGPDGTDPFRDLRETTLAGVRRWTPIRTATFGADTLISMER